MRQKSPRIQPTATIALRRRARALGLCAALLAHALSPGSAGAEPSAADKAAAEVLFEEGRRLAAAGDYARACEKFEASQRLDAGVGTLLYLGDAYEKAGRTASAWATFREAEASAKAAGQLERQAAARDRVAALEPRLSYLTISVEERAPGITVVRGQTEVNREVFGMPIPTDPGVYAVEARAAGKKRWRSSVTVPSEPGITTLTVPALDDAPRPPPAQDKPRSTTAPAPEEAGPRAGTLQRELGLIITTTGVLGLAAGGGLVAWAFHKDSEADEHCDGARCRDPLGVELNEEARTAADVGGATLIAGGALAAVGVVLFFAAPSGDAARGARALRVAPLVAPGAGGLAMGGRF